MAGTTKKKSNTSSKGKSLVAKDIASLKANHKNQIAWMKKKLEVAKKTSSAGVAKLKIQAAAQKKKAADGWPG